MYKILGLLIIVLAVDALPKTAVNKKNLTDLHVQLEKKGTLLRWGNSAYYINIISKVNWYQAFLSCKDMGMELVDVTSQEENDVLQSAFENLGIASGRFWTSATDLEESRYFWMSTGLPVVYTNWNEGEPNAMVIDEETEHCVVLRKSAAAARWTWNDLRCSAKEYFVCEVLTNDLPKL